MNLRIKASKQCIGITAGVMWAMGAILSLPATAPAQQIPAPETGAPVTTFQRDGLRFRLTDAANQFDVLRFGAPMFEDMGPGIQASVETRQQPSGVDLVYQLNNTGTQPARIGRITFGSINLGSSITYQDFRHIGEPVTADFSTFVAQAYSYPNEMYSPVWVVRNSDYAVGFSLQYPVLDYKHDARIMMRSTPFDADPAVYGPRGWIVEYRFANFGDETPQGRVPREGFIPAGEQRTYVISIRVTKNPSEWIRTLVPYRNYFKSMYGGVTYRRDPRPIRPVLLAVEHNLAPANPSGWAGFQSQRPDLYTFRPWMDSIKQDTKWSRVMFWAPTGLYDGPAAALNYPYQFASRWVDDPALASALDPQYGFPSIPAAGMTLGLWWGRSVEVARTWNPTVMEHFDPSNRDHREAAFRELDVAVQAGTTDIGLDTFSTVVTPVWELYPWLRTMRERYPTVKFCMEPVTCDLLHTHAAMFVSAWSQLMPPDAPPDWINVRNEHYLADFLNPGHETWASMSYHMHRAYHIPVTPDLVQTHTELLASLGYVPVMFDDVPAPGEIRAGDSWMNTVPHDLLPASGWNVNYNSSMVVRGPDGRMKIVSSQPPSNQGLMDGEPVPGQDSAGDDDEQPVEPRLDGDLHVAGPTKTIIVTPSSGKSKMSRAAASRSTNRAAPVRPGNTNRGSARSRAGAGISAAALARAGLLGKSASAISRAQVQEAIERLSEPGIK